MLGIVYEEGLLRVFDEREGRKGLGEVLQGVGYGI